MRASYVSRHAISDNSTGGEVLDATEPVIVVAVVRVVVVAIGHTTVVVVVVERAASQHTVPFFRVYPVEKTASDSTCLRRRYVCAFTAWPSQPWIEARTRDNGTSPLWYC